MTVKIVPAGLDTLYQKQNRLFQEDIECLDYSLEKAGTVFPQNCILRYPFLLDSC